MSTKRFVVVGSGAIGLAMSADLVLAGHTVFLDELPDYRTKLPPDGRFNVSGLTFSAGYLESPRTIQVDVIPEDDGYQNIEPDAVIVTTTTHAHDLLLQRITGLVPETIPIILVCGNGSTIAYARDRVSLCETNTAPYGARCIPGGIAIKILTPSFGIAARRPQDAQAAVDVLKEAYHEVFAMTHWIDALFSNPNPLMHPTIMLANLASIDAARPFAFYDEGVPPTVKRLLQQKDEERMEIVRMSSKSFETVVPFDDFEGVIRMDGLLVPQHFLDCGRWTGLLAPTSTRNRYLTEDVPFGLVAWERFALRVGVQTPIMTAEIDMTSAVLGFDCRSSVHDRTTAILQNTPRSWWKDVHTRPYRSGDGY